MIVPLAIRSLDHAPSQPRHATTPRKHLAGGSLRAWPATPLVRSRLIGQLAGRLTFVATVNGTLLDLNLFDGGAGPLPGGPLGWVTGLGAQGPVPVGDVVGAPVVLDLGGGLGARPAGPGSTPAPDRALPGHSQDGQLQRPGRWPVAARPGSAPPADTGGRGGRWPPANPGGVAGAGATPVPGH